MSSDRSTTIHLHQFVHLALRRKQALQSTVSTRVRSWDFNCTTSHWYICTTGILEELCPPGPRGALRAGVRPRACPETLNALLLGRGRGLRFQIRFDLFQPAVQLNALVAHGPSRQAAPTTCSSIETSPCRDLRGLPLFFSINVPHQSLRRSRPM